MQKKKRLRKVLGKKKLEMLGIEPRTSCRDDGLAKHARYQLRYIPRIGGCRCFIGHLILWYAAAKSLSTKRRVSRGIPPLLFLSITISNCSHLVVPRFSYVCQSNLLVEAVNRLSSSPAFAGFTAGSPTPTTTGQQISPPSPLFAMCSL